MSKTFKKVSLVFILALCMTACLGLFIACDNTEASKPSDETTQYSVTVKIDDHTGVQDVNVTIKKGGASFGTQRTDSNGKVIFDMPADDYEISISESSLPAHYTLPDNADLTLSASKPDLTVTLTRKFAYEVKLVDADGAPVYVEGATVQICTLTGNCLAPVDLELGGVAYLEYDKGNYKVIINDLDGYVYECDDHGYYTGEQFTAESTTMEIVVSPATALCETVDEMTAEKKTAYTAHHGAYESGMHANPAYEYNAELAARQTAYYKITPDVSGKYTFFSSSTVGFYFDGRQFSEDNDPMESFQPQFGHYKLLEAGNTYYFKVYNPNTAKTVVRFVVMAPAATYLAIDGLANSASVELVSSSADANAVIALSATSAAKFTAAASGGPLVNISCGYVEPDTHDTPAADEDYTANAQASAKITDRLLNRTLYFTVRIKSNSYPASASVTLTNDGAIADTNRTATVTETLTRQTAPAGKTLIPVPMTASTRLVYNATDKCYHFGTENGPAVVVNITSAHPTRLELGNALAYLDKDALVNVKYVSVETTDDLTTGDTVTDYREFIRGFKDYRETLSDTSQDVIRDIPDTLTQQNCYANYVDENGCYPLTKELETFLKMLYAANKDNFDWNITVGANGYKWMFACYYYGDSGEVDPVVGTYASENGEYVLTVNSGNTFRIMQVTVEDGTEASNEFDAGTWSRSGNAYTFTCVDPQELGTTLTYADGRFTLSFGSTTVTLTAAQS